jgi:ATP-binding cassette subfamily B protein
LVVFVSLTLLYIDPFVALVSFSGFGLFYWLIILYTRGRVKENSECIAKESTQIIKSIQEGLGGIRDVIIDGNQEFYSQIYSNADQPLRRALGNNQFINGSPRYIMESVGMILIAVTAYLMSLQEGGVSPVIPILGALALGAQRILPALQQLYGAYTNIKSSYASFNDVLTLLEQPLPENVSLSTRAPLAFKRSIRINNIGYKYSGTNKKVLKNINITIDKGSVIGLIGPTGSGKSTLIDIIMGLLSPSSGNIYIDNIKIDNSNQHYWRNYIAHVPQNIFLSDSTIEENIAFGIPREEVNRSRVESAAKQAQLDSLIEELPEKYQTIVGERGVRLSGGQRQRIGIARAIYKQAKVLVFDEATSALDSATEKDVMRSIYSLNKDLTILIIAHRVTTLRSCDKIYSLDNGMIKMEGSYKDVIGDT